MEVDGTLIDPELGEAAREFEEELGAAAKGEWEELGIDSPGEMVPASIEELRADGGTRT